MYYFRKGYNPSLWLLYLAVRAHKTKDLYGVDAALLTEFATLALTGARAAHTQGGPVCYDLMSCAFQPPQLTSSDDSVRSITLGGIFSTSSATHTSQFAQANVVWLPYCSSDAWMGDLNNTLVPGQEYMRVGDMFNGFPGGFRGQRIIRAALTAMTDNLDFGTTENTRLLLGGCTPGVIANLDAVASFLQVGLGFKQTMVTVSGFFDSAALLDVVPMNPHALSLANITEMTFNYVNASGLVAAPCAAAYPNETWKCVFGQYSLPFVRTPYLLAQPQYDRAQLAFNAPKPGSTPASLAYSDAFGQEMQSLVAGLPTAAQLPHSAVFSSACFQYCPSMTSHFWNMAVQPDDEPATSKAGGVLSKHKAADKAMSLQQALNLWFFQNIKSLRVVDTCTGFRCGRCITATSASGAKHTVSTRKNPARLAGPILISLFVFIVLLGCCLALATQEPRGRRFASSRGGLRQEEMPLLQRGVMPAPRPTAAGVAAYANLPPSATTTGSTDHLKAAAA